MTEINARAGARASYLAIPVRARDMRRLYVFIGEVLLVLLAIAAIEAILLAIMSASEGHIGALIPAWPD